MIPPLAVVLAYLIGAIPFGYLLVKLKTGNDVRAKGSGNIGATNVLRTTGVVAGVATLLLDGAKGYFAVWLAGRLSMESPLWMSAASVAVMLGHCFPVFLRFQGGKAVATFIGAFLRLAPLAMFASLVVFVVVVTRTRHISAGSIVLAITFPLAMWIILHSSLFAISASICAAALILFRHRSNIQRLRQGTESVLGFGTKR